MSEDIIYVGEEDFQEKVLDSDLPVVVDFWAPWCAPCKIVEPVIEELAAEMEGKVRFAKVNTDENQNLAMKYGIMGIPTMKVFKGGKEVDSLSGAAPKEYLKDFIEKAITD